MNTIYLLILCYGDYDDHNEVPIACCKSREEAQIIADDIMTNGISSTYHRFLPDGMFEDLFRDFSIDVMELPILTI